MTDLAVPGAVRVGAGRRWCRWMWIVWLLVSWGAEAGRGAPAGGDFSLRMAGGGRFELAQARGRVVLIYFGFTRCPDVCPTGLATLRDALDLLGAGRREVLPLFVAIDPERETDQGLRDYTGAFHAALVPLTGRSAEVAAVARAYGVRYRKVRIGGALGYTIDHTADLQVVGRDGRLARILPHGTPAAAVAAAVAEALH